MKSERLVWMIVACVALLAAGTHAATYTWKASTMGAGNWSDTTKWDVDGGGPNGTTPGPNDDVVLLGGGADITVTLDVDATVNSLTWDCEGVNLEVNLAGSNTLKSKRFEKVAIHGPTTKCPIELIQDTVFDNNGKGGGWTFESTITDGGGNYKVIADGGDQLSLADRGVSTFGGGIDVINAGLGILRDGAIPVGATVKLGIGTGIGDGKVDLRSTYPGEPIGDPTATLDFLAGTGSRSITAYWGNKQYRILAQVVLGKDVSVDTNASGRSIDFEGPLSGAGALLIDSDGPVIVSHAGNSAWTGGATVQEGILQDADLDPDPDEIGDFGTGNILVTGEDDGLGGYATSGMLDLYGGSAIDDAAVLNVTHIDASNTGLIHVASGVTEVVGDFQVNGVSQGVGLYNASNGGIFADIFAASGGGSIQVVPEPATLALLALGAAATVLRRRR